MVDPALALFVFFLICGAIAVFAWPKTGLWARLKAGFRTNERVHMEDALKHLYNNEYANRPATSASLAGALEIPRTLAVKIATRLEAGQLVKAENETLTLTEDGRSYAARIVRSHRLWERYLADRTNVEPAEWHQEAERHEHLMSADATEALSSRMGHPRYDPHGDPIPTSAGELPPRVGVALTALEKGSPAKVVHIEDEPADVFDQLIKLGFAPHMSIEVVESDADRIVFLLNGRRQQVNPIVAQNVTVITTSDSLAEEVRTSDQTLAALAPGESAEVVDIAHSLQGPQRRRLLDLGLVPGTKVTAELQSAMGYPMAFRIRGAVIALREQQAKAVYARPIPAPELVA